MSGEAYSAALLDFRRRKDEHFCSGRGPVQGGALTGFQGLAYYPPAPEWSFALPLQPTSLTGEFTLDTNTGESRFMAVIGTVSVPLPDGSEAELLVFGPPGEEAPRTGLVPFRDLTSGAETYGAGRYVDAPLQDGALHLDFNRAYQPYCAYGEGWTCPLPPAQNRLNVRVEAGEKLR